MRKAYLFALVRKFLTLPIPSSSLPHHTNHPSHSSATSSLSPRLPFGRSRSPLPRPRILRDGALTLQAFLQRLPIFSHVFVLLLLVFGPYYAPVTLAVVFLLTHFAFMTSQVRSGYGMLRCWWGTRQHARTDWIAYYRTQCLALESQLNLPPTPTSPYAGSPTDRILPLLSIEHIIIVPNYKESLGTLRETLDVLASHPLAARTYKVCLAMEEREAGSAEKAALLADEYTRAFLDVAYTLHPGNIPGESAGKSSNVAWASRFMAAREMDNPARHARQVITVMDSDTCFASDFFLSVAVKFALAPPDQRDRMMFAPPILFDRNQDDVPVFTRVTDIFWASAGIGGLYPSSTVKIPTSAYAMSMSLAIYVNFWDAGPEAIGEDLHMYTKAMFDTSGHLLVETIYSPASQCNVVGAPAKGVTRLKNDAQARWTQAIRHMWGSLDTGYAWQRLLTKDFGPGRDKAPASYLLTLDTSRAVSPAFLPSASEAGSEPPCSPELLEPENESEAEFPQTGTVSPATTLVGEDVTLLPATNAGADALLAASGLLAPTPLFKASVPSAPPSAWKSAPARIWPLFVLMTRLYEAHLMIAHFFMMVTLMNLLPSIVYSNGSFALLDVSHAPPLSFSLLRTPYAGTPPPAGASAAWGWLALAPMPPGATVVWVMPDLVAATLRICKILSAGGVAFSVVMALMHDVYHREAAYVRWRNSDLLFANLPSSSSIYDAEKVLATGDELEHVPARYLGARPHQTSRRRMPWCLLDYFAIPCGLAFGVAPLLVAQFRQLWTNRLTYTVSAKPTAVAQGRREVVLGVVSGEQEEGGEGLAGMRPEKMEMEVLGVVRQNVGVPVEVEA